jgi:hypothetical protein
MHSHRTALIAWTLAASFVPAFAEAEEQAADVVAPETASAPAATVTDTADEQASATGFSPWFRLDTDSLGTQLWFGASHSAGGFTLASDIYVVGSTAELDVGPSFSVGDLALTPMVGIVFDFATTNVTGFVAPQVFSIYDAGPIYFESWIQWFVNSLFSDGGRDLLYTRNFLLYKVSDALRVGPQIELSYGTNSDEMAGFDTGIVQLPIGGCVNLSYGENNTLGIFLGYETKAADDSDAVAGRFTFIRSW